MIKINREKFGKFRNVKLLKSSVSDTKLRSEHFDFVVIRMGLHHIRDKRPVIDEIRRVLKPRGKVIIIDKVCMSRFFCFICELKHLIRGDTRIFDHFILNKRDTLGLLRGFSIIREVQVTNNRGINDIFVLAEKG